MQPDKNKPIVLVKIGGSLITDKLKPYTVREEALKKIAAEIKKSASSNVQLVIGHGGGSFPHIPAKKYQTHKGLLGPESTRGIAEVAHAVRRLNLIVMKALLDAGVEAVAVSPLDTMNADNFELERIDTRSVQQLLALGMVPVLCGDQVLDTTKGCTIFSTERVLGYTALALRDAGYTIDQIIHCGQTNGVYDADGNTIPQITTNSFVSYKSSITTSNGADVTGGMLHKVEEALSLSQKGISGMIIDGIEHGSLSKAIAGEPVVGTIIKA